MKTSLPLEQATKIAEQEIARIISDAADLSRYQFEPVKFQRENGRVYIFASACNELISQGIVPGVIQVSVDKSDGHIWSAEEFERYYAELEKQRFQQPDSAAA